MEFRPLEKVMEELEGTPEVQEIFAFFEKGEMPKMPELLLYIVRHIWAKKVGEGVVLQKGRNYSLRDLRHKLKKLGFQESPFVYERGQVAFRGEVVDIWDEISLYPLRLEFFDRTLEALYFFDPRTRKPLSRISFIFIYPIKLPDFKETNQFISVQSHWRTDLKTLIRLARRKKERIVVFSRSSSALAELVPKGKVYFLPPLPFSGFSLGHWHFFTDQDFSRRVRVRRFSKVEDFAVGDYVVHIDHGIAKLEGIGPKDLPLSLDEQLVGRKERKVFYYHLRFRNKAYLYVPLEQKNRLTRYVGLRPRLSRLGGAEWARAKMLAGEEARALAKKLWRLYLAKQKVEIRLDWEKVREAERGFEANRPFSLTQSQKRALVQIRKILKEQKRPLDHLLIGPAGSGKTEVGLNVALWFLASQKQVIFLVPTTILASQQYLVAKNRLAGIFKVGLVSRAQSEEKNQTVINDFQKGKIQFLVGTHKLLYKNFDLKNVGLLIVDEEQRFGVGQKEKWRLKKPSLSLLSLTATPIPRTLYLALSRLKTMSVLEGWTQKQVEDRLIWEEDWQEIINLIRKQKDGVYFVVPLIKDIQPIAHRLGQANVSFAVAHGRMGPSELAKSLTDFSLGKVKVLVSTPIVEHGLDLPQPRVMFLKFGARFGLSDLYQLRGRIGRVGQKAWLFILIPKKLPDSSYQRLIDFLDLVKQKKGFYRISERDLELRGEGEIFGKRQHGVINRVGVYLFSQMVAKSLEFSLKK